MRSICDVRVRDVRGAWKAPLVSSLASREPQPAPRRPAPAPQARDLGFDALIVSDALIEVCIRDRVPPDAVIKAMLAKGSVKYGLGMQKGRLEGAKEQLGSLAM